MNRSIEFFVAISIIPALLGPLGIAQAEAANAQYKSTNTNYVKSSREKVAQSKGKEISAGDCGCTPRIDPNKYSYSQPSADGKYVVLYNTNETSTLDAFNHYHEKYPKTFKPARFATCEEAKARGL